MTKGYVLRKNTKLLRSDFEQVVLRNYMLSRNLDYEYFWKEFLLRHGNNSYMFEYKDTFITGKGNLYVNGNILEIIRVFESMIDEQDKKKKGAVYTPLHIVDYINTRVILDNQDNNIIKVIDPACGSGVFLVDALFKLKRKTKKSLKEIVEKSIYGIDIDPSAVRRTKLLLALIVFENEGVLPDRFNIYCANSLDKKEIFRKIHDIKFEAVIGNPPYVRIQNLDEDSKKIIKKYWSFVQGDTDLFVPFIELGISLLSSNGRMGYITPNSYFTSHAGKKLREFFYKTRYIEEIVDFDHVQIFEGITVYTAITIISKKSRNFLVFKKVRDKEEIKKLNNIAGEKINYGNLNNSKWILVTKSEKKIIELIEKAPFKLKDVAEIRVGLATLADKVFIIDNNNGQDSNLIVKYMDGKKFIIEKELTKEIIKVSIIKTEKDILSNSRRIIFPYKRVNGKFVIIEENELKERFPRAYEYLLHCKNILLNRDKGRKHYEAWYAYGRTQGINTTFGKKILTPPMALKPTFVVCEKEEATFYSGYGIFPKMEPFTDLYLLKKILNSEIMNRYIKLTAKSYQGGWKSYSKTFLKDFGLPKLSAEQIAFLKQENDQAIIDEFLKRIYHEQAKPLSRLL